MGSVPAEDELGLLIVVVLKAQNLPDPHKYSKCNPYCVVSVSDDNKGQTIVDKAGGQFPLWDDEVRLTLHKRGPTTLNVAVYSQEVGGNDVLLGQGKAELGDPRRWPQHQFDDWVLLSTGDRQRGEVYLEMTFYPVEQVKTSKTQLARKPSLMPSADRLSRVPQSLRPATVPGPVGAASSYRLPLPGDPEDPHEVIRSWPTSLPTHPSPSAGPTSLTYPPPNLPISASAHVGGFAGPSPSLGVPSFVGGQALSSSPLPSPGLSPSPVSGTEDDRPPPIPPRPDSAASTKAGRRPLPSPPVRSSLDQERERRESAEAAAAAAERKRREEAQAEEEARRKKREEAAAAQEEKARKARERAEEEAREAERALLAAEQRAIEKRIEQERRDAQMAAALRDRLDLDERAAKIERERVRRADESRDEEYVKRMMEEEQASAKERQRREKEDERLAKELVERERKRIETLRKPAPTQTAPGTSIPRPTSTTPTASSQARPPPISTPTNPTSSPAPKKSGWFRR